MPWMSSVRPMAESASFLVTGAVYDLFDQPLDGIAAPLGGNHHAGVEDQSHAGGFSVSRWLLMTSSRSRAKSSSSGGGGMPFGSNDIHAAPMMPLLQSAITRRPLPSGSAVESRVASCSIPTGRPGAS